jgi:group II intron reverse transcriptase/maturase
MRNANTILGLIRERGKQGLPVERVYKLLFNKDLYLRAYGKIYRNAGAMTHGVTDETPDGMSLEKIDAIIEALRQERWQWLPARRTYIPKKRGKKRPLGMPVWTDKLVQEVLRLILEAYFEPQFSDHSHGFRPERGCHTALREIYHQWGGTAWFIEGDISQCFDKLDHNMLLNTLSEHIHDGRFIKLMSKLLDAGYLEDWRYHQTLSGVPQGGIVSPILSNILLDKLDKYVEAVLIPKYTKGVRHSNKEYYRLMRQAAQQRKGGNTQTAKHLKRQAQKLPTHDPNDPNYRRLKYVRYADDFLLGFIGPKEEAEEIKQQIGAFLCEELKLELSQTKTLITHARSEAARFLGYEVTILQENRRQTIRHQQNGKKIRSRSINGKSGLRVPKDIRKEKRRHYKQGQKARHRTQLIQESDFTIIQTYQLEYRGIANYYRLAYNMHTLTELEWDMKTSLLKTLAHKHKMSVQKVVKKYEAKLVVNGKKYKAFQAILPRQGKKPLVATWGGIPLTWDIQAPINDQPQRMWNKGRSELEKRLLADMCELCGSTENVQVHHQRAMKDLHKYPGREKPGWVVRMIAMKRKTLLRCHSCHVDIHAGRPLRRPLLDLAEVKSLQKQRMRRY